jgi:hypothetical protein
MSNLAVITALTMEDLIALTHHWEAEASKWGMNNGTVKSPDLYAQAVRRARHIMELRDKLTATKDDLRQNIDVPLAVTDNAAA